MKIKACIFDLDGVIVDTARFHFLAWRRLANELGFDFTVEQNEELKGVSRKESLQMILDWGGLTLDNEAFDSWMVKKNSWYLDMVNDLSVDEALPGVVDFIKHLRKIGVFVALGSASKNARTILDQLNISVLFDRIVDGNDVINGKPAPDTFLQGIENTDIKPSESIVFEDSAKGIQAALSGNFKAVGIGNPDDLSRAHIVLPGFDKINFSELIARLIPTETTSNNE